jgi:putative oxidoreductase
MSKFLDFEQSTGEMLKQPFPHWSARIFVWEVPSMEILIVFAFIVGAFNLERLRTVTLWVSFVLMSLFAIYTGSILLHFSPYVPCSCGGVIKHLTWTQHLFFQSLFCSYLFSGYPMAKEGNRKAQTVCRRSNRFTNRYCIKIFLQEMPLGINVVSIPCTSDPTNTSLTIPTGDLVDLTGLTKGVDYRCLAPITPFCTISLPAGLPTPTGSNYVIAKNTYTIVDCGTFHKP